jgi:hypothetical protein
MNSQLQVSMRAEAEADGTDKEDLEKDRRDYCDLQTASVKPSLGYESCDGSISRTMPM